MTAVLAEPLYPFLMEPVLMPRIWGGRRLERLGKRLPPGERIGESWEVADLPAGRSCIANGRLAGRTLHEALLAAPRGVLGGAPPDPGGGFPLLVKYLDAEENLSIQVHPTPDYARAHPGAVAKSEAWYVIDAAPGAALYIGFERGASAATLEAAIRAGDVARHLVRVPATAGSCHDVPAGTPHAIGAGVLIAEIQTPSDTTFRIDDWGRRGRALHVEEALECLFPAAAAGRRELAQPAPSVRAGHPVEAAGLRTAPLLSGDHFTIERVDAVRDREWSIVPNGVPLVLMFLEGGGCLVGGGCAIDLAPGATIVIPALLDDARAHLAAGSSLLRVAPPPVTHGLVA
jgi:mannose-6-phosphate isomerase